MPQAMTNSVTLSVRRWSAWAPGVYGLDQWHEWAAGERQFCNDEQPDVSFVPPLLRRRLSKETRMAFRVAEDCLQGLEAAPAYVFCSRYGEFTRTLELLSELAKEEPLSASAFSMSVHNTAAGLYSINRGDKGASSSLASGEMTMETAFVDAWSCLRAGDAPYVLLVYFDAPLPDLYRRSDRADAHPLSVAMLLSLSNNGQNDPEMKLAWDTKGLVSDQDDGAGGSALGVIRLLLDAGPPVETISPRLSWIWSRSAGGD